MPKLKSHRGAKKRFKVTKTGKILHAKSNRRHNLSKKSPKRKRHMRQMAVTHPGDVEHLRHMMPYD